MIDPDQMLQIVELIDKLGYARAGRERAGHRFWRILPAPGHEAVYRGHAEHASRLGDAFYHAVAGAARIVVQRQNVAMGADDRPASDVKNAEAGLLADVATAIDEDTEFLHLRDEILALNGQRHGRVETAAAELVGHIVLQTGYAESQLIECAKVRQRRLVVAPVVAGLSFEGLAVLPTKHHGYLAVALGGKDLLMRPAQRYPRRLAIQELERARECGKRARSIEEPHIGAVALVFVDHVAAKE